MIMSLILPTILIAQYAKSWVNSNWHLVEAVLHAFSPMEQFDLLMNDFYFCMCKIPTVLFCQMAHRVWFEC
jgi:hypothetical protein